MRSGTIYLLLVLVFVASVATAFYPSLGDLTRAVAALPAAAAIIGALFQVFRDQVAHDRALSVQAAQNSFAIGATSHMANVAFDKHVAFCEEYVAEMFQTLSTLFREGPTELALSHSAKLYQVRQHWALWITPDVESELEKFEQALRTIGANAHFVEVDIANPTRPAAIQEMYSLFAEVMGFTEWKNKPVTADRAIATVIQRLRRVLGIDELTELRQTFVARSIQHAG